MKYLIPFTIVLLYYQTASGSTADDTSLEEDENSQLSRVRRGGLSMLRLGRGLQMLRLGKRGLPMMRLGRSTDSQFSPQELQYLLGALLSDSKSLGYRQVPLPRYGKDLDLQSLLGGLSPEDATEILRRSRPLVGYWNPEGSTGRQIRPAPRPGRFRRDVPDVPMSPDQDEDIQNDDKEEYHEGRAVPIPRIGREDEYRAVPIPRIGRFENYDYYPMSEEEKRGMNMLRLGRGMQMLRLGKRPMSMLRLGRAGDQESEDEKRGMHMLRLGKRPFKMLRLGRSDNGEETKRRMNMLRLGKRYPLEESDPSQHEVSDRALGMLRLGRTSAKN